MAILLGVIGTTIVSADEEGQPILHRTVEVGVQYSPPIGFVDVWETEPRDSRVFYLALPEYAKSENVSTLHSYCEYVSAQLRALPPEQQEWTRDSRPLLAKEFDSVVQVVLSLCESWVVGKQGLGVTSPHGILLLKSRSEWKAALIDTGFCWSSGPKAPNWMMDSVLVNVWQPESVEERQRSSATVSEKFELVGFVRCLTLALLGECEVPARDVAPMECWGVLRQVLSGEIATFQELRKKLTASPLSDHFNRRRQRIVVPKPSSIPWIVLPALGLMICGAYFGLKYFNWDGEPSSDPGIPEKIFRPGSEREPANLVLFEKRLRNLYVQSQDVSKLVKTKSELKDLYLEFQKAHRSSTLTSEEKKWLNICRELAEQLKAFFPKYSLD